MREATAWETGLPVFTCSRPHAITPLYCLLFAVSCFSIVFTDSRTDERQATNTWVRRYIHAVRGRRHAPPRRRVADQFSTYHCRRRRRLLPDYCWHTAPAAAAVTDETRRGQDVAIGVAKGLCSCRRGLTRRSMISKAGGTAPANRGCRRRHEPLLVANYV